MTVRSACCAVAFRAHRRAAVGHYPGAGNGPARRLPTTDVAPDPLPWMDAMTTTLPAPTPAPSLGLTAAQRLHLEIYGYVLLEALFEPAFVRRLRDRIAAFERQVHRREPLPMGMAAPEAYPDHFRLTNVAHVDPDILAVLADPRLVAIAREVVGAEVRLHSSDAQIRRSGPRTYRHLFHRDERDIASTVNGLYQFPWIKCLTLLSDVEADDGGTSVIPGSHKLSRDLDVADVCAAAEADPRLIHRIVGRAGSTLVFYESLLHSPGINFSGRERTMLIAGYLPITCPPSPEFTVPASFVATVDEGLRRLLTHDEGAAAPAYPRFPRRRAEPTLLEQDLRRGPAPAVVEVGDLRIVRALFGRDGRMVDVMPLVQRIARGEGLLISWLTSIDPTPGEAKIILLEWYGPDGVRRSRTFEEGEAIHLHELRGAPVVSATP